MPQPRRGSCVGSSELMTFDLHTDASTVRTDHTFQSLRGDALLGSEICSQLWLQANCGSSFLKPHVIVQQSVGPVQTFQHLAGGAVGGLAASLSWSGSRSRDIRAQRSSVPDTVEWLALNVSGWMDGWMAGQRRDCGMHARSSAAKKMVVQQLTRSPARRLPYRLGRKEELLYSSVIFAGTNRRRYTACGQGWRLQSLGSLGLEGWPFAIKTRAACAHTLALLDVSGNLTTGTQPTAWAGKSLLPHPYLTYMSLSSEG